MNEQEKDHCVICGSLTIVRRKYYYYHIECDCCGGASKDRHFEIVRYCENCTPKPPCEVRIVREIQPDEED